MTRYICQQDRDNRNEQLKIYIYIFVIPFLDTASELEDEDDSEEGQGRGYLAAAMNFEPGFFACACMWRKVFFMHPRLKAGAQRGGMTRGVGALRGVLNKFSVNNRKNMFVIKEVSSGNVFYLR